MEANTWQIPVEACCRVSEIHSIELVFLLAFCGWILSGDFVVASTERAVGTWTTSNWLLYLNVCQIISYPMILSIACVCKSSPIHSAAFAIGRSICRQVSRAASAMAEQVRTTFVHQRRWLRQWMLLTCLACIASFANFKGTLNDDLNMFWTIFRPFWCFHLAELVG